MALTTRIAGGIALVSTVASMPVVAETGTGLAASPLQTLAKMAAALLLVLVVFWVCAKLLSGLQQTRAGGAGELKLVASLSLGHRERVVVISTGTEQLMLGVTPSRIERLHVLEAPLSTGVSGVASDPGDFARRLVAAVKRQDSK